MLVSTGALVVVVVVLEVEVAVVVVVVVVVIAVVAAAVVWNDLHNDRLGVLVIFFLCHPVHFSE